MVEVYRTTSAAYSVRRNVVDKGQIFVQEFNIYPSLISQMKVGDENLTIYYYEVVRMLV